MLKEDSVACAQVYQTCIMLSKTCIWLSNLFHLFFLLRQPILWHISTYRLMVSLVANHLNTYIRTIIYLHIKNLNFCTELYFLLRIDDNVAEGWMCPFGAHEVFTFN